MQIILSKNMPNGSVAERHNIVELVINSFASVTINSLTADGIMCWREVISAPLDVFSGDPILSIAKWLTLPGSYLASGILAEDLTDLEVQRASTLSRLDRYRDAKIAAGCPTGYGEVQTDDVSIRNILGSVQTASLSLMLDQPFATEWRLADNSDIVLNAQDMVNMGITVMTHVKTCYQKSWAIKAILNDPAATVEGLKAFPIERFWDTILDPEEPEPTPTPTPEPAPADPDPEPETTTEN